jgi:hypothetical protein
MGASGSNGSGSLACRCVVNVPKSDADGCREAVDCGGGAPELPRRLRGSGSGADTGKLLASRSCISAATACCMKAVGDRLEHAKACWEPLPEKSASNVS